MSTAVLGVRQESAEVSCKAILEDADDAGVAGRAT
jgi:hypothetical protein